MALGNKTTTPKDNPKKQKKASASFWDTVYKWTKIFFDQLIHTLHWIGEFLSELLRVSVHLFSLAITLITDPMMPCVASIAFVVVSVVLTGVQWWEVGSAIAVKLGIDTTWIISCITLGTGALINYFQLAPNQWKIRKDVALGYKRHKIDTDYSPSNVDDVKEKVNNWGSVSHSGMKWWSRISYMVEGMMMLGGMFLRGFNTVNFLLGIGALFLPEISLKIASYVWGSLGAASNPDPEDYDADNYYEKTAKF